MFKRKHAAIVSGASGIISLVATIGLAVSWSYWSDTLDMCPESGCTCVLYGQLRGTTFYGGSSLWCRFLTYLNLVASLLAFAVTVYLVVKLRSGPQLPPPGNKRQYDDERPSSPAATFSTDAVRLYDRADSRFSSQFKVLCTVLAISTFIYACFLSEGYRSTCSEYKPVVSRHLKASGDLSDLVMERLSCGTMYDFLDYLHPDSNYHIPHIPQYQQYRRTFRINTGFVLFTSVILSWINFLLWCTTTILLVFRRRT